MTIRSWIRSAAAVVAGLLLTTTYGSAQNFIPYPGTVSVVTDGGGALRSAWNGPGMLRTAVLGAWIDSHGTACDELRRTLGAADRIARGVTAYDIQCDFGRSGELFVDADHAPFGAPLHLRFVVPGNLVEFSTTTPTVLGRYADPDFSVRYDLELRVELMLPSAPGPLRVASIRAVPTNSKLDSRNFTAGLGFALNDVNKLFGGSDFVALAQRMIDGTPLNLTGRLDVQLGDLNTSLAALPPGALRHALDRPGTPTAGTLDGRTLPNRTARGPQLLLVHHPWQLGSTPADPRSIFLYAVAGNGDLLWFRRDPQARTWTGPRRVGNGWGNFSQVMHAGGNTFYGLTPQGVLKWYRHDGMNGGTASWQGPRDVATGWHRHRHVFAASNGVFYVVQQDGRLAWYRHQGFADGSNRWIGPRYVGTGWGDFTRVVAGGEGVIYALRRDGRLAWYRHEGHETGEATWSGPVVVATDWGGHRHIIPAGEGVILAARDDGRLLWLRHRNHLTAGARRDMEVLTAPRVSLPRPPGQRTGGRADQDATVTAVPRASEVVRQRPAAWDDPVQIGSGWLNVRSLIAVTAPPRDIHVTLPRNEQARERP
jgi:hypothetical protein